MHIIGNDAHVRVTGAVFRSCGTEMLKRATRRCAIRFEIDPVVLLNPHDWIFQREQFLDFFPVQSIEMPANVCVEDNRSATHVLGTILKRSPHLCPPRRIVDRTQSFGDAALVLCDKQIERHDVQLCRRFQDPSLDDE